MISSLVDVFLHFKLLNSKDDFQQATREIASADKIHTFQETVGTPFVAFVKDTFQASMMLCQHWQYLILVTFPY